MLIIETPVFTRRVLKALSDEEYRELQNALRANPRLGVDLGGGLYKVRWGRGSRGKSGGVRCIYYWARPRQRILMLFLFFKSEQDDLTPAQEKALRELVGQEYPQEGRHR